MDSIIKKKKDTIGLSIIYVLPIALYFMFAPFEDVLTSSIGTLAKYIAILIVGTCFIGFLYGNFRPKINSVVILPLVILLFSAISVFWSIDKERTFSISILYAELTLLYVFIISFYYSSRDIRFIESATILGGVLVFIYLLVTRGTSIFEGRLTISEENDPNNLAALLILPFAVSIKRLVEDKGIIKRLPYVLSISLTLFLILLTGSRGGLLATVAFLFIYFLTLSNFSIKQKILSIIIILIIAFIIIKFFLSEEIFLRLFTEESYESNITAKRETRTTIWKVIFTKVLPKMSPLGLGAGCTSIKLGEFFSTNRGSHNTYLDILCQIGYLGLSVFLLFLFSFIKKLKNSENFWGIALIISSMVVIFFLDSYSKKFFWNVLIFIAISLNARSSQRYVGK